MKLNRLLASFICFLSLTFIVACNNNEESLENDNKINENDTISSIDTDASSEDYPHTQPIRTQDAKYKFKPTENKEKNQQPMQLTEQQNEQQSENQSQSDTGNFESTVVELTNAERQKQGLPALEIDTSLSEVAGAKSSDMEEKGYFSHTSPTYGSPFDMIRDFGVSYQSADENISHGQRTPEEVVNAWMNSEGHRENILNSEFTHIGVGFEQGGYHWTQMFIQK